MEYLKDFLNEAQQNAISDYKYISDDKIQAYKMKKGDYIKFMLKENYQFMEGGIIIYTTQYPIITIKPYKLPNYSLDLTKVYVFYKKNKKNQTRREYFEEYLKNLSKASSK
jgi:hypothetical protein